MILTTSGSIHKIWIRSLLILYSIAKTDQRILTVAYHPCNVTTYRRSILQAAAIVTILVVFAGGGQGYSVTLKDSVPFSIETDTLSEQIKQLVRQLEYSDEVAEGFAVMVNSWKDTQGKSAFAVWRKQLAEAQKGCKRNKISKAQAAKVEETIIRRLSQKIKKEIGYNEKLFDLADVVKYRQAQCLGYAQLFYVLGNSIGLPTSATNVLETAIGAWPAGLAHTAGIVCLTDGKAMLVDLVSDGSVSTPFIMEKEFKRAGNYWELKDNSNHIRIDRKIQILDKNKLIAYIYNNRGSAYSARGQYTKALSAFTNSIGHHPKCAQAYSNRGIVYRNLDEYSRALSDFTCAIKLNPIFAEAYTNRGVVYSFMGKYTEAIRDYTKAIELNPKLAVAYYNRAIIYGKLHQFTESITDCDKAIKLNPKLPEAYGSRAIAYSNLGRFTSAVSDYTKAIQLNPEYARAYTNRGTAYVLLKKTEKARKDFLKAVELDSAFKPEIKKVSEQFRLNLKLD